MQLHGLYASFLKTFSRGKHCIASGLTSAVKLTLQLASCLLLKIAPV